MKKILIILVFLLLVGCTNDYPDFNDDVTITLNITSEVDPIITSSRGEGVYDSTNKVYTLTVSTVATVDISLAHEGYETLTLSFSSTDLLQGDITRDVEFIQPPRAKVVLAIKTSAPTNEIILEGYEYTNSGNTFTIHLPHRNIDTNIKITADGYQEVIVPIKPEMLVVGYYQQTVMLPREDEVVISYRMLNNSTIDLLDLYTHDYLERTIIKDQVFYVLEKGTEVYYANSANNSFVYLKAETSQEIFPFGPVAEKYYILENTDSEFLGTKIFYYEYQNQRYRAFFERYDISGDPYYRTNIPIGAKILYLENFNIAYKKTIDEEQNISLSEDNFNELTPLRLKIKIHDIYNDIFLNRFWISDVEYEATNNYFTYQYNILYLEDYYIENDDLLLQEYHDGEWTTNVNVIPKENGLIIRFKDVEGNIITFGNDDYKIYPNFYLQGFIIDTSNSLTYSGREFNFTIKDYLPNLERVEIDGKKYYVIDEPITINTDEYQFIIYFETTKPTLNIEVVINKQWYFYGDSGPHFLNIKKNEVMVVRILDYTESKIPTTYESRITMTEELLRKGMAKFDDQANHITELPSFKLVPGENVEIIDFELSNSYYYIENDKIYYLVKPDFLYVSYKIGEESFYDTIVFDPLKTEYIID